MKVSDPLPCPAGCVPLEGQDPCVGWQYSTFYVECPCGLRGPGGNTPLQAVERWNALPRDEIRLNPSPCRWCGADALERTGIGIHDVQCSNVNCGFTGPRARDVDAATLAWTRIRFVPLSDVIEGA